jgi:hypothetical protein
MTRSVLIHTRARFFDEAIATSNNVAANRIEALGVKIEIERVVRKCCENA